VARAGTVLEQDEPPLTDQAPETQGKHGTTNRLSSVDDLRGRAERAYVTMRCSIAVAPEPPGTLPRSEGGKLQHVLDSSLTTLRCLALAFSRQTACGQSTHSTLYRGPASSIRWINSSVTGGGAADGSSTGVQTSRNQPSIPAGV
jgi:hypothetical protein